MTTFTRAHTIISTRALIVLFAAALLIRLVYGTSVYSAVGLPGSSGDRVFFGLSIPILFWAINANTKAIATEPVFVATTKYPTGSVHSIYLPNARSALNVFLTTSQNTTITRAGSDVTLTYDELEKLAKQEEAAHGAR